VLRPAALSIAAGAASALVITAAVMAGPGGLSLPVDPFEQRIVTEIRVPRVGLGLLAGAGLATAGTAFQALFRNALATPYTVGVSAGASLGAAIYVYTNKTASLFGMGGTAAAIAGAIAALILVFVLARSAGDMSGATLLLAGVAVSFVCTSLLVAIQYSGDVTTSFRIGRWLLGGLETIGFGTMLALLPFVTCGVAVLLVLSRHLDVLSVGDEWATIHGVGVDSIRHVVFGVSAAMVAVIVASCGPIGFVGLVVPHIGRLIVGPSHRRLVPFCAAGGGVFLVLCDTVGRTVVAPVELPVGVVTALVGGPFFLAMLVRAGGSGRRSA
jgi:iron complex transport system permease protein